MKVLRDFTCLSCNTTEEWFTEIGHHPACSGCGGPTTRVLSAPQIHLESISGDFPSATMKWTKDYEQRAAKATDDNL